MNTWLDLIIPIPFLIIGLVVYYRRKNMSDIEYQDEMKQIQSLPDDSGNITDITYNFAGRNQASVFAHTDD